MSGHNEDGKSFRGIQDRLKMFEQNKTTISMNSSESTTPTVNRLVPPSVRKPPLNLEEITKQRLPIRNQAQPTFPSAKISPVVPKPPEKLESRPQVPTQVQSKKIPLSAPVCQIKPSMQTKVSQEKIPPPTPAPPVKLSPSTNIAPEKFLPSTPAPPPKVSQYTNIAHEKLTPPTPTPPVKVLQSTNVTLEKVPPPTPAPPVTMSQLINASTEKNPSSISILPPKVQKSSNSFLEKILPPTPALPVKVTTSFKADQEKIPSIVLMPPVNIPAPPEALVISTDVTQEIENIKLTFEKVSHPQPPLPPPEKLSNKAKSLIDFKASECPPPVPPPPPVITKTQSNVVVGWAIPSNNVICGNAKGNETLANVEITAKNIEKGKPPPILVAPPSIESFEKAIKQHNEIVSNIPQTENETYDEDDDFTGSAWYFNVTKTKATQIMRDCAEKGSFMVRPSDNNQYVLMIRAESDIVKKFKIQRHKDGWVLGDPSNWKRIHTSISKLMEFYCENGVKVGSSNIKLKEPVSEK